VDFKNITLDILRGIPCGFDVVVVVGHSYQYLGELTEYSNDKEITIIVDPENMSDLMLGSDLAIGTAGSTSWERCCLALPTILFIFEKNQETIGKNLHKIGAVELIQFNSNFEKELILSIEKINNKKSYLKISNIAQNICDGLGVSRVKNILLDDFFCNE
jgi:spore coat polysaccharide biosynthesis predicted glycosyltransferase SpsG